MSGLIVGLTGGIASGKTTVSDSFAALGIAVHDTDVIARELVAPGAVALQQIVAVFGESILDSAGALNRRAMRDQIFANAEHRARLEAILHPAIGREVSRRTANNTGPYQVIVVPLLLETGMDRLTRRVLVVDCPVELQIARVMARDGESEAGARRILDAQTDRQSRIARAHDLLVNNGTPAQTRAQVALLDVLYRWLGAHSA